VAELTGSVDGPCGRVMETGHPSTTRAVNSASGNRTVAVCEIFSVKEWRDLENRVRVRTRSLEMVPFDRSPTSSYSPSIVTMTISCIVCEI